MRAPPVRSAAWFGKHQPLACMWQPSPTSSNGRFARKVVVLAFVIGALLATSPTFGVVLQDNSNVAVPRQSPNRPSPRPTVERTPEELPEEPTPEPTVERTETPAPDEPSPSPTASARGTPSQTASPSPIQSTTIPEASNLRTGGREPIGTWYLWLILLGMAALILLMAWRVARRL
ncbi:MAG TPA: hypothetical protein VGW36_07300 [Pyrinomonadaceae bacterium]|nr:hypothetical protein [Pyrinomonadaceae bacterium]